MNIKETETYLILRYGSMSDAYRHWQMNTCFSAYDISVITEFISYHLNEPYDAVDKQG